MKINKKIIKITDAQENQFIRSFNIETGKSEFREIKKVHEMIVKHKDQIKISFENSSYITSKWHPSLVLISKNKFGYKKAEELNIGDKTINSNGEIVEIKNIDLNPEIDENYMDLTVDLNHNYFCSDNKKDFHVIHNTRKGAIAVYVEPWHMDIIDFIDLKKNSGEERRRAHDLFPALWITDLFMERIQEDGIWTLFDPYYVDLSEYSGEEFKAKYIQYENDESIPKDRMKAKDLWKKILTSYFESGSPFLCFKDTANKVNPNKHVGKIRSSNLCVKGDTQIQIKVNSKVKLIEIKDLDLYIKKYKNIKTLSMNTETNKNEWKKITAFAMTNPKAKVLKIKFNGKEITCTAEHKIYTKRGYIEAQNLKSDDIIIELQSDATTKLEIIYLEEEIPVYDITVEDNHNFYANGLLVHNCTEIFQNTAPNYYKVKIEYTDGSIELYNEDELIQVKTGVIKKAKKITALDSINNKRVFIVEKEKIDGDTAVCNLASINLSRINTEEDLKRVIPVAVRMLDNVIDLNFYPVRKVKATNLKSRSIGLGVMGEAQMLAEAGIYYGSQEHFEKIDEIMDNVSYYTINASADLAKEKGSYATFEGSEWSKGTFPIDYAKTEVNNLTNRVIDIKRWDELRTKVKNGIRNGYLMAIAPTSSISILVGTTQAIEPCYKRKWYEENLSGLIPVTVPNLNAETFDYYTPSFEVDQLNLIRAGSIRQKWIDQGQSLNIFMSLAKASGKYLNDIYLLGWKLGLKSTYYLRSQSPEAKTETPDVADRSTECVSCQ